MSVQSLTLGDIQAAASLHDLQAASRELQKKAGITDPGLFEITLNEEMYVNSASHVRRVQMLLSWLLVELAFELMQSQQASTDRKM